MQYSLRAGLNDAKQNRDTKSRFNERANLTFDWMGGFRSSFFIE